MPWMIALSFSVFRLILAESAYNFASQMHKFSLILVPVRTEINI